MGAYITDYSIHETGINEYITQHHPRSEDFRRYRIRWDDNKDDLLFVLLETVSSCNLKCPMCIHSVGYKQIPFMSDDVFSIALKNIRKMNVPSVCMNATNEPLLDSKIFSRIGEIAGIEQVFDIMMNTNAALMNKDVSSEILESGLTRLLIGVDGFYKETYEKMRKGASYERVMRNILDFLELKKKMKKTFPVVRISLVRTSLNENEIEKFIEFWRQKVDYVSIQEYLTPVADHSKDYLIPSSGLRMAIEDNELTCRQPFERVVIRANADVLPCCSHMAVDMPVGNLREKDLSEIWNGPAAEALRSIFEKKTWRNHPVCGLCLGISSGKMPAAEAN